MVDWEAFESEFFKPEEGRSYRLVLSNWRNETSTFGKQETNPKPVLVFDVLNIDGVKQSHPKTYSTANLSLIFSKFRPMIEDAESRGEESITVFFQKDGVGAYSVISGKIVEHALASQEARRA